MEKTRILRKHPCRRHPPGGHLIEVRLTRATPAGAKEWPQLGIVLIYGLLGSKGLHEACFISLSESTDAFHITDRITAYSIELSEPPHGTLLSTKQLVNHYSTTIESAFRGLTFLIECDYRILNGTPNLIGCKPSEIPFVVLVAAVEGDDSILRDWCPPIRITPKTAAVIRGLGSPITVGINRDGTYTLHGPSAHLRVVVAKRGEHWSVIIR